MDSREQTRVSLDEFKGRVVNAAQSNLRRIYKNTSGKLSKSIEGQVSVGPNSMSISFSMEDYGMYQDQGVSGKKKKYDTPYSYREKMPPPSKFDRMQVRKGIAPRGEGGRFTSRKRISFAIARKIFMEGIKPTKFFTSAFNQEFQSLPDEIVEKYALDMESTLKMALENGKRN